MMKTKKTIALGLILAGLAGAGWATASWAKGKEHRIERRMEHLKKELGLTADQEAKIRQAFEGMREKIQALREQARKDVASILTPEQRKRFEAMKEKRKHDREK